MPEYKQLLVFFASPHKDGHTAKLLEAFLKGFEGSRIQIETVDAYQEKILPCLGCGYCAGQEACAIRDFDGVHQLLEKADGIVVASPVYNLSFPAPFKAILDRTQRYFEARFSLGKKPPLKKPKKAVLLLSQGSQDKEGAAIMEKQLSLAFSVMNTKLSHTVLWEQTDKAGTELPSVVEERAFQVALAMNEEIC